MSNLTRTIKSLPLIAVLFTCVVLLSSAAIFASEDGSPSSEVSSIISEPAYDQLAKGTTSTSEVRATTRTLDDIYNLIIYTQAGNSATNAYAAPQIAAYTQRIGQILYGSGTSYPGTSLHTLVNYLKTNSDTNTTSITSATSDIASMKQLLRELHFILNGDYSGIYVRPSIQEALFTSDGYGNFYTVSDLLGMIWAHSGDILTSDQAIVNNTASISSNITGLKNLNWISYPNVSFTGVAPNLYSAILTSQSTGTNFTAFFNIPSVTNIGPSIFRVFIPVSSYTYTESAVPPFELTATIYYPSTFVNEDQFDVYYESTTNGVYLYLIDFIHRKTGQICFNIASDTTMVYNYGNSGSISYLPFDSYDYQIVKTAFNTSNFASLDDNLSKLADYLVSPEKQAAENASQPVIDDTLSGFTGNGSAAAKTSDTGAMKNMSGSIQSGLDSGASASNATSVFSNQTFWSWFTQSTSDGINSAYPAPVVQQTRGSGDEIPDFLSGNQAELNDLLNQRNSW